MLNGFLDPKFSLAPSAGAAIPQLQGRKPPPGRLHLVAGRNSIQKQINAGLRRELKQLESFAPSISYELQCWLDGWPGRRIAQSPIPRSSPAHSPRGGRSFRTRKIFAFEPATSLKNTRHLLRIRTASSWVYALHREMAERMTT